MLNKYDIEPSIMPTVPRVYDVANWGVEREERCTRNRSGVEKSRRPEGKDKPAPLLLR